MAALVATGCLCSPAVRAESKPHTDVTVLAVEDRTGTDAEELFRHARELHRQKRWQEARDAYDRAWQLERTFQIAANLALVELRLGRARDAAEHLSFALAHLPASDPKVAEARTHLEEMMKEATARVGTLKVELDRDEAVIYVDDQPVGAAPLQHPIYLEAGRHVVHVQPSGAPRITRELSIEPGVVYRLALSSAPPLSTPGAASAPAPDPVQASPQSDRNRPLETRFVVVAGEAALTLVALGLGTMFGLQANSSRDRADELRTRINAGGDPVRVAQGSMCDPTYTARPPECAELSDAVDDTNALVTRSTVAFIVAGGLAATSVATYLLWPKPRGSHEEPRLRLSGLVTDKTQMVGLAGAF